MHQVVNCARVLAPLQFLLCVLLHGIYNWKVLSILGISIATTVLWAIATLVARFRAWLVATLATGLRAWLDSSLMDIYTDADQRLMVKQTLCLSDVCLQSSLEMLQCTWHYDVITHTYCGQKLLLRLHITCRHTVWYTHGELGARWPASVGARVHIQCRWLPTARTRHIYMYTWLQLGQCCSRHGHRYVWSDVWSVDSSSMSCIINASTLIIDHMMHGRVPIAK